MFGLFNFLLKCVRSVRTKRSRRRVRVIGLFGLFAVLGLSFQTSSKVAASGTVSGTVYIDYNMNGARNTTAASPNFAVDKGISAVTVTAYDNAGTQRGSTTSTANGSYSLAATGTGPYRLEFSGLPAGYMPSAVGTNNGSAVRFVADGNSSGIDFGVISAKEYCQNNPDLITTCFSGTVNGNSADPVLVSFPYISGTTSTTSSAGVDSPTAHALAVPQNQFGSVWGLAYHKLAQKVFAAAFTKRHAGFRNANKGTASNDPTGEIFISNKTGTTGSLFINLNTLFGSNVAGANPHDTTNYETDSTAFDAVGKTAFGDLDISEDEQTLYVTNLQDRKIYAIPLGTGTPTAPTSSGQVTVYDLAALMNPGTGATGCPLDATTPAGQMNRNLRPGALKYSGGRLYVGLTCTAQSTSNIAHLRAFVYEMNPAGSGSAVQVANFALNYTRGCASISGANCANAAWRPWTNNVANLLDFTPFTQKYLPQPWLLDIEFDQNNFMILGMSDRLGHQTGNAASGANTGTVEGVSAGDTLRMYKNGAVWTLENNASDNTNSTGGAGTGQGPGNGEFYHNDGYTISSGTHSEVTLGGLLNVPGFQDVVISAFDPAPTSTLPSGQNTYRAGGMIWLNNISGARSRSYQVFGIDAVNTFGKASGIGDIEAMCDTAPLQIGNRVWNDANGDGIQGSNEGVLANVVLQLWADTDNNGSVDTQVGSATTDVNGNYVFGGPGNTNLTSYSILPGTVYQIRVLPSNFNTGNPLANLYPTSPDADVSTNGDSRDSDGIIFPGDIVTAQLTTGSYGANNHSFDFGFRAAAGGQPNHSLGNRVWFDTNNNGIIDPTETGISGVSVSLFLDADANGQPDTPGSPIGTLSTSAGGYYRFDSLIANTYVVRINPANFGSGGILEAHQNTAGNNTADAESYGAVSNAENGINPVTANSVVANGILSNPITLSAGAEPVSEADVPSSGLYAGQNAFDSYADMTVDFGFFCMRLSGTVWNDTGAGANNNNGLIDTGESFVPNLNIRLYDAAGVEIPVGADGKLGTADDGPGGVLTNGSGNYSFECLPQGGYRVVVQANGTVSSGPTETDPNLNGDNNDNGFPDNTGLFPGKLISGIVTLTPGSTGAMGNNTVNNAAGLTSDPTVDFGVLLAPTQVKLDRLDAYFENDAVVLEWGTGGEADNLGFNVYRTTKGGSELLNSVPVAGSALRSNTDLNLSSNDYRWIDKGADAGSVYYIEDIDLNGTRTMHGPIWPQFRFSFGGDQTASTLLTGLKTLPTLENQQEVVVERENGPIQTAANSPEIDKQQEIAAMRGLKISLPANELYTVPFEELAAKGFDTASDPSKWQLYTEGREVPFRIIRDETGRPAIEIFGERFESRFTAERLYYLVIGEENGRRIDETREPKSRGSEEAASYRVTSVRKERGLYASSVLNGDAENWFGSPIMASGDTVSDLQVYDPDQNDPEAARLRVKLQGLTSGDHLVNISFNGVQIGTVGFLGKENREFEFDVPMSEINEGPNSVSLRAAGSQNDISLIDQLSLRYSRHYKLRDGQLRFTVPVGQTARVGGLTGQGFELFELDAGGRAFQRILVSTEKVDGRPVFRISRSDSDREFAVFDKTYRTRRPSELSANLPSKLHESTNGADMLILAPRSFQKQAEAITALKKIEGLEAVVVDIEDVYDEYSFGMKSDRAIRELARDAGEHWQTAPRYLILFGDSSYDMRNYLGQTDRDVIPTRLIDTQTMETSSDGWFSDFDGDGIEDIPIGRLPAGSTEEANRMVSKLERYRSQERRKVRGSLFVADRMFENYSETLESVLPADVTATKLNRSTYTDPVLKQRIVDGINGNPMAVTYTGHGTTGIWAGSSVFGKSDALRLSNQKLSLFMLMTCLNGFTHNGSVDSLGESLFKAENGAIAVWASSGSTYAPEQLNLSKGVMSNLFRGNARIGDLARAAKHSTSDMDVRKTWQLIGDPSSIIR